MVVLGGESVSYERGNPGGGMVEESCRRHAPAVVSCKVGVLLIGRGRGWGLRLRVKGLQGYLAHQKKKRRPRTLQQGYACGPMVILGGWAVSYERGPYVGCMVEGCRRGHAPSVLS